MEDPNELPEKTPETKDPQTKKSSPIAPVIETPVPPQVMNPSAPPDLERKKTSTGKRKRSQLKHYVKIDS